MAGPIDLHRRTLERLIADVKDFRKTKRPDPSISGWEWDIQWSGLQRELEWIVAIMLAPPSAEGD